MIQQLAFIIRERRLSCLPLTGNLEQAEGVTQKTGYFNNLNGKGPIPTSFRKTQERTMMVIRNGQCVQTSKPQVQRALVTVLQTQGAGFL